MPVYPVAEQAEIDQEAANIREWLTELSPGTIEWIREDDSLRSTLRAILADCAGTENCGLHVLGWLQMMADLR